MVVYKNYLSICVCVFFFSKTKRLFCCSTTYYCGLLLHTAPIVVANSTTKQVKAHLLLYISHAFLLLSSR